MIDVLLATYRPDVNFLEEQRMSILAQEGVQVRILSREDDEGLGPCMNFAKLLECSTADYAAFCDQDDVWMRDKLVRSMDKMKECEAIYGKDVPILVFTDAKVVDGNLRILDESLFVRTKINPKRVRPSQLILQNVANGNTMLFNAALRKKVGSIPCEAFMHDHWMMLVASAFGHIVCLNEPTLLYRQHSGNVLGGAKVGAAYYLARMAQGFSSLKKRLYLNILQAAAFALRYSDAPECFKACLNLENRNWAMRRWILLRHGIFKNGFFRNIGLFLVV